MELTSTFDPLQQVWPIGQGSVKEFLPCSFCEQTGNIKGANGEITTCPKCHGRGGEDQFKGTAWKVGSSITIGEIRLIYRAAQSGIAGHEKYNNTGPQKESFKEEYMCVETGIGSGTIHHGDRLFASIKEAEEECQRLNGKARPRGCSPRCHHAIDTLPKAVIQ